MEAVLFEDLTSLLITYFTENVKTSLGQCDFRLKTNYEINFLEFIENYLISHNKRNIVLVICNNGPLLLVVN